MAEVARSGAKTDEVDTCTNPVRDLKQIRKNSQVNIIDLLNNLDQKMIQKVLSKKDVINFILENGEEI